MLRAALNAPRRLGRRLRFFADDADPTELPSKTAARVRARARGAPTRTSSPSSGAAGSPPSSASGRRREPRRRPRASAARRRGATRRPRARPGRGRARRREAEKAEASVRRRERIGRASAALDGQRAERIERQERLVEALEDEAKHWLVDDATIDAKITPELFSGPPASTGLVTRESHAWWRYAATVDGPARTSAEDELLLNRDEEATRVATTTERLIRTQAAHPREFHRVLDDGAAIAGAIADLDVQHLGPRVFRPRGRPLLKLAARFFYSTPLDVRLRPAERALHGRATGARDRASVGPRRRCELLHAGRVELMAACERRRIVEVLQADRALLVGWRRTAWAG